MAKRESPRPAKPREAKSRDSAKKGKLRDLSRRDLTAEEEQAAYQAFLQGGPTVTALLGQAMVEYELDRLLRSRFKRCTDEMWIRLTDDRGPLATFSARITMGRAFGLFDEAVEDHLNRIRKIRNAFAHAKHIIGFDNTLILDELRACKLPSRPHSLLRREITHVRSPKTAPDMAYRRLCMAIFVELIRRNTRGLNASARNYQRAINRRSRMNPYSNALTGAPPRGVGALAALYPAFESGIFHPNDLTSLAPAIADKEQVMPQARTT